MTRTLKRFFISSSLEKTNSVLLPREETHHLKNVLRMKEGELCLLFDSEGREFVSRIKRFLPDDRSEMSLIEAVSKTRSNSFQLTVAQAIPQDRKMDGIVRQAAELGIYEIIPVITERTVARLSPDKSRKVIVRWQRIADQTLKQSRLNRSPKISEPTAFHSLCEDLKVHQNVFILGASEDALPIKNLAAEKISDALLIIGPEGGFSKEEIQQAECCGAQRISLGSGILKTDTAFVAAASFFKLIHE